MTAPARGEPANPLPAGVRTMWRAETALVALLVLGGALVLASTAGPLMPWLAASAAAAAIAAVVVVPSRRHRGWRWEVGEEEIDLLHGVWAVTRTIVPITRIQHVSVQRTGWTDVFGLVRVAVHTAAGVTTIPGLRRQQADEVRDWILARLRSPDDL